MGRKAPPKETGSAASGGSMSRHRAANKSQPCHIVLDHGGATLNQAHHRIAHNRFGFRGRWGYQGSPCQAGRASFGRRCT